MASSNNRNLALNLLITAHDGASAIFGKVFKALNDSTNILAGKVREAFTGVFGGAIDGAAAFEKQLSAVQAKGEYTAEEMEEIKAAAERLGREFGISGEMAAQGMEALSAAGLSATETIEAVPAVLAMAKAEGISMDTAAEKLADSLSIVGMNFSEAGKMADLLAKGANISTTSATGLAEALSVAGGIAKTAGLNVTETVGALSALANAGIKGSAAGTSLAATLTHLLNPSSAASAALDELGISSRKFEDVIGGLQQAGPKANKAILAFGETAGPGLRALIGIGQEKLTEYTKDLDGAEGAARTAADALSNNFSGAMDKFTASFEATKIALADPLLKPLTDAAKEASAALNDQLANGALKPVQEAIKTFAVQSIAAVKDFLGSFDFSQVVPAIQSFATTARDTFQSIGEAGTAASNVISIAWNSVAVISNSLVSAFHELSAGFYSTLTAIETVGSRIGMGTIERANELQAIALKLEAEASASFAAATQNAEKIRNGYGQLISTTDTATTSTQKLAGALTTVKDATPSQEIAELEDAIRQSNQQIEFFQNLLKQSGLNANVAAQYASQLAEVETNLKRVKEQLAQAQQAATTATKDATTATTAQAESAAQAALKIADVTRAIKESTVGTKEWNGALVKAHEGVTNLGDGKLTDVSEQVTKSRDEIDKHTVGLKEWNGALIKVHDGVVRLGEKIPDIGFNEERLSRLKKPIEDVNDVLAEFERQLKASAAISSEWKSGMDLNALTLSGLKEAATSAAEKLAYL